MSNETILLGECLTMLMNGATIKQTDGAGGVPITRIETLSNNQFNRDRLGYADIQDPTEYERYILDDGDILMSHINSRAFLGRSVLYKRLPNENIIHGMNLLRLKTDGEKLNNQYAYYFFQTELFKRHIDSIRKDAVNQSSIAISDIRNIKIDLPDLETQHSIVSVLSSLDRKIALNRKANELLESMAKQLYDYWFVQFDFPNAEGKPYKSSGGKMVYNETLKREIPEGWEVKQLSELLELSENGEWGQEEMDANTIDINCIRGADIVDLIGAPRRYLPNNKTSKLMQEHDIIVEISGGSPTQATGRCNYVTKEILDLYNGKLTCSNFCKFLRLEDKEYAPYFYYLWSLIYQNGNMFHYEGKTSGIKNLQIDNLLAEYWCIPPKDMASHFFKICTEINSKAGKNKKETLRLTSLRDYLLPLLMNGQVKVL